MVAKMHMAAEQNTDAVEPASQLVSAHPKALKRVVAIDAQPTLEKLPVTEQKLPPLEFSSNCAQAVERVYGGEPPAAPAVARATPHTPLSPIAVAPRPATSRPEFTPVRSDVTKPVWVAPRFSSSYRGPQSGPQLYQQRLSALQHGRLYTRLPSDSFREQWQGARSQPTYEQWKALLNTEARAAGLGQGSNNLSVILGDSISLWLPTEALPAGRLWLNQGISGDTTQGILNRLSYLKQARPNQIYVMAGINDLRRGATDEEILSNLQKIMQRLRSDHPQAQIVVQSILPTGIGIPNHRIRLLNRDLALLARGEGVEFLNLYSHFADARGELRPELTTDGLHLSAVGYNVWQSVLREVDYLFAQVSQNTGIAA